MSTNDVISWFVRVPSPSVAGPVDSVGVFVLLDDDVSSLGLVVALNSERCATTHNLCYTEAYIYSGARVC